MVTLRGQISTDHRPCQYCGEPGVLVELTPAKYRNKELVARAVCAVVCERHRAQLVGYRVDPASERASRAAATRARRKAGLEAQTTIFDELP